MSNLLALMHQVSRQHSSATIQTAHGEVVSYDVKTGTVVVKLEPEGIQVGPLSFYTPWAGTPGTASGLQFGPEPGLPVKLIAFDTEWDDVAVFASSYTDKNKPPGALAGEAWLQHKDAATFLKLQNSGNTDIGAKTAARLVAPLIQLSNSLASLTTDDAVVRKADLTAVVNVLNALMDAYLAHQHIGNMGAPTPFLPKPADASLVHASATGSSIVRAKA